MVVRKRSKQSRHRGSHTHGWGGKKKHRNKGSRGGKGNAGRGKRGAQWKPSFTNAKIKYGKLGFKMHGVKKLQIPINLGEIQENISILISKGFAEKKGDSYFVDVSKIGYDKVLGAGILTLKLQVKADHFSEKALEKIKKLGGEVIK